MGPALMTVSASWAACLLTNCMIFSSSQTQQMRHLKRYLSTQPAGPALLRHCLECLSRYASRYLMNWMIATMSEPKAMDPRWYLQS